MQIKALSLLRHGYFIIAPKGVWIPCTRTRDIHPNQTTAPHPAPALLLLVDGKNSLCAHLFFFFAPPNEKTGLVSAAGGHIRGCMPEIHDGANSNDTVSEMFLNEDSEHYLVYDEDERKEFLFHVMKALKVGGAMAQGDDKWDAYLDLTRKVYKDFLSVRKNATTGKIEVSSKVYRVTGINEGHRGLFPNDNPHSFCYLVFDPAKKTVAYWFHAFMPWW